MEQIIRDAFSISLPASAVGDEETIGDEKALITVGCGICGEQYRYVLVYHDGRAQLGGGGDLFAINTRADVDRLVVHAKKWLSKHSTDRHK
jgi:hypothetical protein